MEITLTVNGKQVKATVDDAEMKKAMGEKKEKRTGYECCWDGYGVTEGGYVEGLCFQSDELCRDSEEYQTANFYTNKKVAENNARADTLMRKLRRFAAEHGGCRKPEGNGWMIVACSFNGTILPKRIDDTTPAGTVCFSSNEAAYIAITQYYDELNWYFTEYDPMPEGWWEK